MKSDKHKPNGKTSLTPQPPYLERDVELERCPNCHDDKIKKTPRRKAGPAMFHCRKCGYLTNIDLVYDMYRLLGRVPA